MVNHLLIDDFYVGVLFPSALKCPVRQETQSEKLC